MAGTATAPDVTGAITGSRIGMTMVDASGDVNSVGYVRPGTTAITPAQAEAFKLAYQAATQSSVFLVEIASVWEGAKSTANATALQRSSVKDGINMLFKNVGLNRANSLRLVAPVEDVMVGNSDNVEQVSAELVAVITTWTAILTAPYTWVQSQFTERRERRNNPRSTSTTAP